MAVAKAWSTGHSVVTTPQLRPSSSSSTSLFLETSRKYSFNFPNIFSLRKSKNSKLCCHCSSENNDYGYSEGNNNSSYSSACCPSSSSSDWDWNRWTRHFSEIQQAESYASVLKFQLDKAIEKEDFLEAAKLKIAIAETISKDSIAEIMSQLKNAIDVERYQDASQLCRNTGSGLVGWWVGYSKDSDDPFGRLIQITPGVGRFVGRSYSPRQLVTSSQGTPMFEIFVVKDANGTYKMQVVFLKRTKGNSAFSSSSSDKSTKGPSASEIENAFEVDERAEESEAEKTKVKNIEGTADKGIKSVINLLKEKIPELKVKVMKVNLNEDTTEDTMNQLIEEDNENDNLEEEASDMDSNQPDLVAEDSDTMEDEKNVDMKLYIAGVLHNTEDTRAKDEFVRVPAYIKDMERDSFVLNILRRYQDHDMEENAASQVKFAAVAAQGFSELVAPNLTKAFLSSDKVSSKVLDDLVAGIRVRINSRDFVTSAASVEAVKLTGDLNVPAGEVTFRAKIGKGNQVASRGLYPDELGVVAGYRGQGKIAEFGFKNPKWIEGELLQLNGKDLGPYVKGADLGFLYVVPEQSFLVLFNRLNLPE